MDISIIICSKNREAFLGNTLDSLREVKLSGLSVECIVVDNGSTDQTREVVRSRMRGFACPLRYEYVPKGAKAAGLNQGLAVSTGAILSFTDDDIRFSHDWLHALSAPLQNRQFEAVTGEVRIASHLQRGWMKKQHRLMLAEVVRPQPGETIGLVGANMAFLRTCLEEIPAFDFELGPGALGLGEEGLLGNQFKELGWRIGFAEDATVEHHFDEKRLLRSSWLKHAEAFGRSAGYVFHHWNHAKLSFPALRSFRKSAQYFAWKLLQAKREHMDQEGITEEEIRYVNNLAFLQQLKIEQQRPPNYQLRGLSRVR